MVYQTDCSGCGKAVVRDLAVLAYEDDCFQVLTVKEECRDFHSIRLALAEIGIECLPYAIKSLDLVRREQLPAIAQVRNEDSFHFVVVRKIGRRILVDDPEFGTYYLKKEEFLQDFTGMMLLFGTKGKPPAKPRVGMFGWRDYLLFSLTFVLQFVSLFLAIYFMGEGTTLVFSTILLSLYALFSGLGFLIAMRIRKRLTSEIFLPYLKKTRVKEDGPLLARILNAEVNKAYSLVQYGVLLGILLTMFSSNGLFFSALAILGAVLGILSFLLERETNYARRYCAKREKRYFALLGKSLADNDDIFLQSERKATSQANSRAALTILRGVIVGLCILCYMFASDIMGLNFFLFNLFLTLAISQTSEKLLKTYLDDSLESRDINSLSYPLPSFLLNMKLSLGYTNKKNGGGAIHGRKKDSRLSGQDRREKDA